MRASIRKHGRVAGLAALAGATLWHAVGATASPGPALDRRQLMRLLGAVPDGPPPLAPEQVERVDLGDVIREKVTYAVEPGERVPAFLFLPRTGAAPRPAVLCHHQHGGEFDVGKDGPAGLGSTPDQHYAIELARHGYVTLAPDAICFN